MVEANTDSLVVTARIRRETRDAAEERARDAAAAAGRNAPDAAPAAAPGVLTVEPAPRPVSPPPDAATFYRHARLGVVAVVVLVLFWTWLRQRRG